MYFDSHAHLDDAHFDGDRAAILDDLKNHGVTMVMNVGCDLPSSERSVRLAEQYPFLYAAVGSHPDDADHVDGALLARYRALCASPRVRAIGEIGLDYQMFFHNHSFFHLQIQDTVFLFIIRGFIDTTSSHATKVWVAFMPLRHD